MYNSFLRLGLASGELLKPKYQAHAKYLSANSQFLRDEGDKTNKEYDAVTKDNRRLNDKLDRYRKKLDKADKDYEKLKRRKEQQKNLFDLLKDDSKTLRVENKTLKERIEALERGKKEAITTTSQSLNNGECPMDLSTQESNSPSTAELESKLEESEKKVVELEQKIKDLNGLLVRRKAGRNC